MKNNNINLSIKAFNFIPKHIGSSDKELEENLQNLQVSSLEPALTELEL